MKSFEIDDPVTWGNIPGYVERISEDGITLTLDRRFVVWVSWDETDYLKKAW